jgi:hypothetical protein
VQLLQLIELLLADLLGCQDDDAGFAHHKHHAH